MLDGFALAVEAISRASKIGFRLQPMFETIHKNTRKGHYLDFCDLTTHGAVYLYIVDDLREGNVYDDLLPGMCVAEQIDMTDGRPDRRYVGIRYQNINRARQVA